MNARQVFAAAIERKFAYPCMATQDAIDRIVDGAPFSGRVAMLEMMRSVRYGPLDFNSSLLSAWKPRDIELATGRTRDYWIDLAEKMG